MSAVRIAEFVRRALSERKSGMTQVAMTGRAQAGDAPTGEKLDRYCGVGAGQRTVPPRTRNRRGKISRNSSGCCIAEGARHGRGIYTRE